MASGGAHQYPARNPGRRMPAPAPEAQFTTFRRQIAKFSEAAKVTQAR